MSLVGRKDHLSASTAAQDDGAVEGPLLAPAGWWILGVSCSAVLASVLQVTLGVIDRGFFIPIGLLILCAVAAGLDTAMRRIPNTLTYPALLAVGAISLAQPLLLRFGFDPVVTWTGAAGPVEAWWGFALCAGLGLAGFFLAGLGGGDAKLLAVLGAGLGLAGVVPVLCNALLIATAFALINVLCKGKFSQALQNVALSLFVMYITKKRVAVERFSEREIPLAPAFLLGVVTAPFWSADQLIGWVQQ